MHVTKPVILRPFVQIYKKLWRQLFNVVIDPGFLKWTLFIHFILKITLADCH